jgi:hypothetical protein
MRTTPAVLLAALALTPAAAGQDRVRGHLITFQDNGAWSWFEDERAVVDRFAQRILVGSCADDAGLGGAGRGGDIDIAYLDLHSGLVGTFELHDRLQGDDHNSPALLVRPDGRYLAMYGMHGGSGTAPLLSRWRVSQAPGEASAWIAERTFQHSRAMSYSNLHHLPGAADGRGLVHNFVRAANFDPNVMVSTDLGETFTGAGKLLTEGGTGDRPYLKYADDGATRVHLITTERHPRDFDNSIHHGYVEDGALHDSFGTVVDPDILDASGRPPGALTRVFATGTRFAGTAMRRAWTVDLGADAGGRLRALFIARAEDRNTDHRLFLARFDGSAWTTHEVCAMGGYLYAREDDYTGLAALHPDETERLFVSTRIDPRSGAGLARYEIFDGTTHDGGASWTWTAVTEDSSVDNLRPIVPRWSPGRTALLWFRGSYRTYTDYATAVVGIVDAPELRIGALSYHDATPANTRLVDGSAVPATGPAAGQGPTDGLWHRRSGFGNGGEVWTADELGSEDVPVLRTTIAAAAGFHDVFLLFWSNASDSWLCRAGLAPGALRSFEKIGVDAAEAADFTAPVTLTGSTVRLYKAYLGRAEVAASGVVEVFVDDLPSGQTAASRTWYDGVALAPVAVPAGVETLGHGCGGPPVLALVGDARLGGPGLTALLAAGPPGAASWLLLGLQDLRPTELGGLGFAGCTVYPQVLATRSLGLLSAAGTSAPSPFAIPNDPALIRLRLALQGVCAAPASGLGLTAVTLARLGR